MFPFAAPDLDPGIFSFPPVQFRHEVRGNVAAETVNNIITTDTAATENGAVLIGGLFAELAIQRRDADAEKAGCFLLVATHLVEHGANVGGFLFLKEIVKAARRSCRLPSACG